MVLGCDSGSETEPGSQVNDWSVEAIPTRVIGSSGGNAGQLFENIVSAVMGPNDQIIVADGGALDVRVFDASGALTAQFGREGEGPGEFTSINGLWITPEDQVAVWDAALRRMSVFSLDGSLVTTSAITATEGPASGNVEPFVGVVGDGDVVLAALSFGQRGAAPSADRWELLRFGQDAQVRGTLGSAGGFRRAAQGPLPLTQIPSLATSGDRVYVVDGYGAEIRVIDAAAGSETTLAVGDLPTPSEEAAWAALEPGLQERAEYSEFAGILLQQLQGGDVPRDGQVPTIAGMLADDTGMLWIKEFDPATDPLWLRATARRPGPGGNWRVLAPQTGELVAAVAMPAGVVPLQVGADRLLGLAVDDLGVQRVVEHTVVRGSR